MPWWPRPYTSFLIRQLDTFLMADVNWSYARLAGASVCACIIWRLRLHYLTYDLHDPSSDT
jgi:hypothetical protein